MQDAGKRLSASPSQRENKQRRNNASDLIFRFAPFASRQPALQQQAEQDALVYLHRRGFDLGSTFQRAMNISERFVGSRAPRKQSGSKHLTLRPARVRLGQRVLLFSASSAKSRTGNAIKTDSQKSPRTVCSSTYVRLGSTLTISGERDAPRWL